MIVLAERFAPSRITLILLVSACLIWTSCSPYILCPIPSCQVRMLHAHGGVTYRGQPWWRIKRQNPRVGEKYIFVKDKNLVPADNWFTRTFGKKPEKRQSGDNDGFEDIKARDPNDHHGSKNFDTEEQEEDNEKHPKEKEGE